MIELLRHHDPASPALIDTAANETVTYGQLCDRVLGRMDILKRRIGTGVVALATRNSSDSIAWYLACLAARCPVILTEASESCVAAMIDAYAPDALIGAELRAEWDAYERTDGIAVRHAQRGRQDWHPDLALLLATSGTTANPKTVRLTLANVLANARSITAYLGIGPDERAMQMLPVYYSYGLSVINSHLLSGASVLLTQQSLVQAGFWAAFRDLRCTSIAGVPYIYEILQRLRFDPRKYPALRTMTQAGGGLKPALIGAFHEKAKAAGNCRFFVMYGQTEATARISYVPWERLGEKVGSIGIAIPGGSLSLAETEDGARELVYRGPNVMLGYASSRADLALPDEARGVLRTGDLARADDDGFYYVEGRLRRIAKLFGKRVNLDDVEKDVEIRFGLASAALQSGDGLRVHVAALKASDLEEIAVHLMRSFNVPRKAVSIAPADAIPHTPSGKKDYKALGR